MASLLAAMPRIPKAPGLRPEHIVTTATAKGKAKLIDPWGRSFPLCHTTRIGRNIADVDIAVLDNAVSMIHADISRDDMHWWITDLGSTNGTFVNGRRIDEPTPLFDGHLVVFGYVGFIFVES